MKETEKTIEIMGKPYRIKCPEHELESLQLAANYLEEKMQSLRASGNVLSLDRIAVITALNMTHQLLKLENTTNNNNLTVHHRLRELQDRVETALAKHAQMELAPAE